MTNETAERAGRDKPPSGRKISRAGFKFVEASMDEARAAIEKKKFDQAVRLLTKVLGLPENEHSAEAQELLGVAYQKAGRLDQARKAYEQYLRHFKGAEGSERVRQRLAGILTAAGADQRQLIGVQPASRNGKAGKSLADGERVWFQSGSLSSYYIRDDSSTTVKDISTAPDPNADPDAHRVHQQMFLTNYDLFGSIDESTKRWKYKFAMTHEHALEPRRDTIGISTAYVESTFKNIDLLARFGRQSRNTGGVMGRFDGGLLSWQANNSMRFNVVAGSPNWSRFDAPFKDEKLMLGASVDFTKIGGFEASLFAIQQNDKAMVDRQGVGAELRYFDNNKSALATVDYDLHFQQLNAATFSGSYIFPDKSVLTTALDYRKVPYLSSWNALVGQPFLTLYDMLKANSKDEIQRFAVDRTPTFKSAMLAYSYPLSAKFQLSADATVTNLSGTPPSGGIDGTPASGTEYYFGTQLIASSIFKPGDMFTAALRYAALSESNVYVVDLNSRYPLTGKLAISPRLNSATVRERRPI